MWFVRPGSVFATFVNWASLVSFGVVYFVLPLLAFVAALWKEIEAKEGLTPAAKPGYGATIIYPDTEPLLPEADAFDPLPGGMASGSSTRDQRHLIDQDPNNKVRGMESICYKGTRRRPTVTLTRMLS